MPQLQDVASVTQSLPLFCSLPSWNLPLSPAMGPKVGGAGAGVGMANLRATEAQTQVI